MNAQLKVGSYMRRKNLSQQAFADLVGVSQMSISKVVRGGKPGIGLAYKLSRVLGVKPETLMK